MSDTQFRRPWWNRRDVLKGGAALAAGAWGLSPYWSQAAAVPTEFDGSKFKLAAPEPNAKPGGVLRVGMPNRARISICISPARSSISARWDACSTI